MLTAYAWLAIAALLLLLMIIWTKRINKTWLVVLGTAPVAIAYVANPVLRLRSYHSLLHAGIVYQILNGNIPPSAPLIGGYPLKYPWGAHLLVAGISKVFSVTPLTSFAFLNIVTLVFAILLVHRISRLMIDDETANILSVVIAIYGVSLLPYPVLKFLQIKVPAEPRGIPVFSKFTNINALPIGLTFVLLSLYSALRLLRRQRIRRSVMLMLISVVGTGFFYFPFLPGLVAGVGAACLVMVLLHLTHTVTCETRPVTLMILTLLVGLLILAPYLMLIGGRATSQIGLFSPEHVLTSLWKSLVACGPILIVIMLTARRLSRQLQKQDLVFLASFAGANLICFICIGMPAGVEYKFLILSTVAIGIVGGIAFGIMRQQTGRFVVVALLILFIMPSFRSIGKKVTPWEAKEPWYFEKGIELHTTDHVEDRLYTWIRENTSGQAIFVDRQLEIPVLAQRQLFAPASDLLKRRPRRGLASLRDILLLQCGHDVDVIKERGDITDDIYARSTTMTSTELAYLNDLPGPVYVICRASALREKISKNFDLVFTAGGAGPAVYALRKPTSDLSPVTEGATP